MNGSSSSGAAVAALVLAAGMACQARADSLALEYGGCVDTAVERTLSAGPANLASVVATLQPGDLLTLDAGTYTSRLALHGLHGQAHRCIVIQGPESGDAVFLAQPWENTVGIRNSSYLVVRDLVLDGSSLPAGATPDAVKGEGSSDTDTAHHVTIEGLTILGYSTGSVYPVAISSKIVAWNWVIRGNRIEAAGTGLYLGNSDGGRDFSNSLVEHNVVVDSRGYNMQVKHQASRSIAVGAPAAGTTVIRHNVFSKAAGSATGGDCRPCLLLGHWPLSGAGSEDNYLVYGNFFWQNQCSGEALVQAEGNVILYDNLFVNEYGTAVLIQDHNDVPRRIRVFFNTILAAGRGISLPDGGDPAHEQKAFGNAVFAATPIHGVVTAFDNVTGSVAQAGTFLANPDGEPGSGSDPLDLFPIGSALDGTAIDLGDVVAFADSERDFNSTQRPAATTRGAYTAGPGNPGWLPELDFKPEADGAVFADGFESGGTTRWAAKVP